MLAMSEINCIKVLRNQKSKSVNSIAEMLGINWRTAKKYADKDWVPQETVQPKQGMMYEEGWGEIVSDWLIEDYKLPYKKRRTNKAIFAQLQAIGFEGSYRTVCHFIKDWREGKINDDSTKDKGYERLQHPPGEAQVDFGLLEAVKDGQYVDVHGLSLSLPYSNATFCVPLPSENQECFLKGLETIFKQMGAVPRVLRIDNLKAAVIKPRGRHQEVEFTHELLQFSAYYGCEIQACNPYSGHEKGHVENKVGYIRYNFTTPAPVMTSYEQLTDWLEEQLTQDRQRQHYVKQQTIEDLYQDEHQHLLHLPDQDYPIFKEKWMKANKYGEIVVDQVQVHVPKSYNFGHVRLVLYWDQFKVTSPNGEIFMKDVRPYMHKRRQIPSQGILSSWLDKPRAIEYSRYQPYLPVRIFEYIRIEDHRLRKARLRWLIHQLAQHDMEQINDQFYDLIDNALHPEHDDHPYDVDWSLYDQNIPSGEST